MAPSLWRRRIGGGAAEGVLPVVCPGQTVGKVTAPSIGTYNWPSVGVTDAVPTWSNTKPK